jgi:hypothetical protein
MTGWAEGGGIVGIKSWVAIGFYKLCSFKRILTDI